MSLEAARTLVGCIAHSDRQRAALADAPASELVRDESSSAESPAPPQPGPRRRMQHPPLITSLLDELDRQQLLSSVQIGRMDLSVRVEIKPSVFQRDLSVSEEYACEVTTRYVIAEHAKMFETPYLRPTLPYALEVACTGYNTEAMPIDLQLRMIGVNTQREGDPAVRDHVLPARSRVPRNSDEPHSLLTTALALHDEANDLSFASVEALGFDSRAFWDKVALAVPPAENRRAAALFPSAALLGASLATLDESSTGGRALATRYYRVPLDYYYLGLLMRVHKYLGLRDARDHLPSCAIDARRWKVPLGSRHATFERAALEQTVRFVDARLVDAHPLFSPRNIAFRALPYDESDWKSAWDKRQSVSRAIAAQGRGAPRQSSVEPMVFTADYSVYYTFQCFGDQAPPRRQLNESYLFGASHSVSPDGAPSEAHDLWTRQRAPPGGSAAQSSDESGESDEESAHTERSDSETVVDDGSEAQRSGSWAIHGDAMELASSSSAAI